VSKHYDLEGDCIVPVSEEEMKIVREKGEKKILQADDIQVTTYYYNGRAYIEEVKRIKN
jgi:hypothetical protein